MLIFIIQSDSTPMNKLDDTIPTAKRNTFHFNFFRKSFSTFRYFFSEFDMALSSDSARKEQLLGSRAKKDSPMSKFMWGKSILKWNI